MYDKIILENRGMFGFIPDCCKNQKMCDKTADNYSDTLIFVTDCHKTQKMCHKDVGTYASAILFVADQYKT